ncbi:MAG: hypothetical protein ABIE03_03865 [Patescibacteria group bacterium]|nr:hypothetical protein [Patescibacteria group bacterium]
MKLINKIIQKFLLILLFASLLTFIYSEIRKDYLPSQAGILEQIYTVPEQIAVKDEGFEIKREGTTYEITPKYSYELYGLIVSAYDTDIWYDITHANDPLNTKDICVIWGENIKSGVYQKMKYRSGEFTCFFEFKPGTDSVWYDKFDGTSLSNNHLLPETETLSKLIKSSNIGDQIHLKGLLIDYSIKTQDGTIGTRDTSTVRTDTGCEIIYTTDFEILKKGNESYHTLNLVSKYAILTSFVALVLLSLFQNNNHSTTHEQLINTKSTMN